VSEDTDYLQAQSDPYRRMSANLFETKERGRYYHIHGSLEASTTLDMIGLEPFRPDLKDHDHIVGVIEPAVKKFTVQELEDLNATHRQAGVEALKHEDFIKTPHVSFAYCPRRCTLTQPKSGPYKYKFTSVDHHMSRKSISAGTVTSLFIRETSHLGRHKSP
jgi:hypothetical protein